MVYGVYLAVCISIRTQAAVCGRCMRTSISHEFNNVTYITKICLKALSDVQNICCKSRAHC